jgi:hypothetical protein
MIFCGHRIRSKALNTISITFAPQTLFTCGRISTAARLTLAWPGKKLFDIGGEEDFYDLVDVPDEARVLFYARKSNLEHISNQ